MKKMILAAMMMVVAMSVSAQHEVGSITFQPKVGVNGSLMYMNNDDIDLEGVGGFIAGAEFEYRMTKWLAVSAGAMYSQQGGKVKHKEFNVEQTARIDFVTVPIMANFYVWKGLALKIGVEPAFKVRDDLKMPENNMAFMASKYSFGEVNRFDLRVPLGVSYDFGKFSLEFSTNGGLTKAMKNKDYYNAYASFRLGYKFSLK